MKDLIILVADLDTESVLSGFLPRLERVCGTRLFTFDIRRHINRDPGCANESADFLRSFSGQYRYAMVVFDREGSGQEKKSRAELEDVVQKSLEANGWAVGDVAVVVLDPEIENWMWANSPHVSNALRWKRSENLYDWLVSTHWLSAGAVKPERPKEAVEAALRLCKTPRSSSIYREVAERASFLGCTDPAFVKMLAVLQEWFKR
jgi:hypothetical protein